MRTAERGRCERYRAISVMRITFRAGSGPVRRGDAERERGAARGDAAVHEDAVAREHEVRKIRGAVAVRERTAVAPRLRELAQAARLFPAAPIGRGQRSIEPVAVPGDAGGDDVVEPQLPAELRHVEVDARGHQHEEMTGVAVPANGGEG